jgi:hypothetical protein
MHFPEAKTSCSKVYGFTAVKRSQLLVDKIFKFTSSALDAVL